MYGSFIKMNPVLCTTKQETTELYLESSTPSASDITAVHTDTGVVHSSISEVTTDIHDVSKVGFTHVFG
jgi:hypothetical protein